MDMQEEIAALSAETMALQILLVATLKRLPKAAVLEIFEEASNVLTVGAMSTGLRDGSQVVGKALKLVEQLRETLPLD